jgi:hypothetical protein
MTQPAPFSPSASWRIFGRTLDLGDARQVAGITLAYLALHLLLWTLLPTLSHRAPPWDNIEQLVWTQSLEWGYYKHPPAPTWWMYFWTELLGRNVGVTFFAAQLSVVGMLYCVWRMALLVTTPVRALVAVVFTSLIAYHGLRGIMANHNTLQLLPVGLLLWSVLAAVRAVGRRRWLLWALVGAAAALCVLSKYSAGIWFAAIGLWLVIEPRMHRLQAWGPVLLAVAVGLLLLAPHIAWMAQTDFATLRYAQQSVDGHAPSLSGTAAPPPPSHWVDLWNFTTAQLGRLTPALLAFAALCGALRKAPRVAPELPPDTARERRFVGFMALGPVALTLLLGVAGVHLASSWATTFFVLFGVLLLRWTPFVDPARLLKITLCIGIAAQVILAGGLAMGRGLLVDQLGRSARSNFPAPALALELEQVWKAHGHTPLHVVAGDTWLSGNVSIHLPTQPLVWIDADRTHSPWVDDATLARCDTLVLIDRGPEAPTPGPLTLQLMEKATAHGTAAVPWTSRRDGPVLTVEWGVVRAEQAGCPSRRSQH